VCPVAKRHRSIAKWRAAITAKRFLARLERTRPSGASVEGGLGLWIMQYRAEMIGATLKVSSAIDKGATVDCTFKIN